VGSILHAGQTYRNLWTLRFFNATLAAAPAPASTAEAPAAAPAAAPAPHPNPETPERQPRR